MSTEVEQLRAELAAAKLKARKPFDATSAARRLLSDARSGLRAARKPA